MSLTKTQRWSLVLITFEFLFGLRELPAAPLLHAGRVRATHKDLSEVVTSTCLIEPKRGPAGGFAAVYELTPFDIAEMAIGAALHEAHWYDAMNLAIRIYVFAFIEACTFHQRAAAVCLAVKDLRSVQLGYEPVGELGTADAAWAALSAWSNVVDRRFP